jgi:hypothetical protein
MQLERRVVVPRRLSCLELEAVRLVVAGEEGALPVPGALHQPELDAPPRGRLVEIRHPKPDMVDPAQADHEACSRPGDIRTPARMPK